MKENLNFIGKIQAYKINFITNKCERIHIIDTYDFFKKNKTPSEFKTDFLSLLAGTASPNIRITNIALSTNPDLIANNSTSSMNIARLNVSTASIDNSEFTLEYNHTFTSEIANTKFSTVTVITSQTQITLFSASGFRVGDGIKCKNKINKIIGISGNNITLEKSFEVNLIVGDIIEQIICRVELLYDTGLTFNVGKCISIASLEATKNSNEIIKIRHLINIFGT